MATYSLKNGKIFLNTPLQEASALDDLSLLAEQLVQAKSSEEKCQILDQFPVVRAFIMEYPHFEGVVSRLSDEGKVVFKELIACGQEGLVKELIPSLVDSLLPAHRFYHSLGGLVGYQRTMLSLLSSQRKKSDDDMSITFHSPKWWDITRLNVQVKKSILEGVRSLPQMGEIYPLGGAGDRLSLVDERDGEPLPAAKLAFRGKTLVQGLIEDLQAREYLYFKLTGTVLITPVAIMTSHEKDNHRRILGIFEEQKWFGRPKESFRFFTQPLVPVMDREGKWCLKKGGGLLLKPGGHGVMWKLAEDEGIFAWFFEQGRSKALVRQVNNPIAGCDYGLLAFSGIGCREKKEFGFASCPRLVGSHEGMNVLIEKQSDEGFTYSLTNIEYCTFQKRGIVDQSEKSGSPYSRFPSNTNILFVDLKAVQNALKSQPIPGMLVNMKKCSYFDSEGSKKKGEVARLESTMQNIADEMTLTLPHNLPQEKSHQLSTYLTYNKRTKTISCTKRKYAVGSSFLETPEGAFFDVLCNAYELLTTHCGFDVPKVRSPSKFFRQGPSFLFSYHPALGPIYSVIAQKIKRGSLSLGSSLDLQIAELDFENVDVEGSLSIVATNILGYQSEKEAYSNACGKCCLKNVTFGNRGIDFAAKNTYWKDDVHYNERFEIIIHGSGEFQAENVTFSGSGKLVVEDGTRLIATQKGGTIHTTTEPLFKEPLNNL